MGENQIRSARFPVKTEGLKTMQVLTLLVAIVGAVTGPLALYFQFFHKPTRIVAVPAGGHYDSKSLSVPIAFANSGKTNVVVTRITLALGRLERVSENVPATHRSSEPQSFVIPAGEVALKELTYDLEIAELVRICGDGNGKEAVVDIGLHVHITDSEGRTRAVVPFQCRIGKLRIQDDSVKSLSVDSDPLILF